MTERWENELRHLRGIRMPERVRLRTDDGPRGDGMPPRPHRLVAALVAFSVFAVAGTFAWRAFRPTAASTLGGSGMPTATVSFLASGQEYSELPRGEMTFEGRTIEGQMESFGWEGAIIDTSTPEFREPLRIEPETLIEVQGDAEAVSGALAVVAGDAPFPWEPTLDLDLSSGSAEVPVEPGTYALAFTASWPQGSPTFWFPIEVVGSQVVGISADAAVIEVTRDPVGATLTFGDQVQHGIVTDVWEPTGEPDDGHRAILPELDEFPSLIEVPAGTELSIVGDVDGWTVYPQPDFDVVRLAEEPGPAVFAVRTGWHGVALDVAFGIEVIPLPSRGEGVSDSPSEETSARLVVTCEGEEAVVLTPVVLASKEGVRVVLRGVPDDVSVRFSSIDLPGVEWLRSPQEDYPIPLPAGEALVSCDRNPIVTAEKRPTAVVTIVSDGAFVPFALSCAASEQQRIDVPAQERRAASSVEEAVRAGLPDILVTDRLELAGYVDGSSPWLFTRLIRDDRTIAWFLVDGRSDWHYRLLYAMSCAGTEIGRVDPDQDGQLGFG